MEHSRKQKLLMIVALIVGIASLSIGFAAFSVSLNISSSASVTPNSDTFSVKFSTSADSLIVGDVVPSSKTNGLITTNGVINNGDVPTLTNLSATFTKPGDFVEYIVYARNEGEYTAYLNNIKFIGKKTCVADLGTTDELVQNACSSIYITVSVGAYTYTDRAEFSNHPLASKTGEAIKIKLLYTSGASAADGPFMVTFPNISLVYSTVDDSTMKPNVVRLESGDLNTPGSIVSIGNEKFYVIGQENRNVKLLSMYNLYVGNSVDEERNVIPLANPTGIQNENAKGMINYNEFPWIATVPFSTVGIEYSGSIVEGYVKDYVSYLEGLGANISNARLILSDELIELGCVEFDSCSLETPWVWSTSYWTGSVMDYELQYIWVIQNGQMQDTGGISDSDRSLGVRPVIEIPLSEF